MVVNLNEKDIRFNSKDSIKLLNKGLISRSQTRTPDEFIIIPKATILISKKINNLVDVWVSIYKEWKFVEHGNIEELERLFEICDDKDIDAAVEEVKEVLPVEEPVETKVEEVKEEVITTEPEVEPEVEEVSDVEDKAEEVIDEVEQEVEEVVDEVTTDDEEPEPIVENEEGLAIADIKKAAEEKAAEEESQAKPSDPTVIPVKATAMNEQFKVKKKYNNNNKHH